METQSQYAIRNMSTEELVQFINDNIDTFAYPIGEIAEADNEEYWDKVNEYLTGYEFMKLLTSTEKPKKARYVQIDTDSMTIYWYTTKKSIIETPGEETLCEWYECTLD